MMDDVNALAHKYLRQLQGPTRAKPAATPPAPTGQRMSFRVVCQDGTSHLVQAVDAWNARKQISDKGPKSPVVSVDPF